MSSSSNNIFNSQEEEQEDTTITTSVDAATEIDFFKGRPVLRTWELQSDSSRYDYLVAAPSDEVLHQMWSGWAGIALIAAAMNLILLVSMLCSRPVRTNTFNVYLMAIIVPDIVFSLCCGITCLLNALYGKYWSHWMCNFQQFYFVFGLGANAWMNALIAYQLHTMLCYSSYRRRFKPPTRQRVLWQTAAVYLYVCFLGTWGLMERPWFPFYSDAATGLICTPLDKDKASSIVFWVVFLPIFMGIPISYVQWVCWDVYRRNLMPPAGKSRTLTVYFSRLIIAFLVMWTPNFIMMFIFGQWLTPWAHWAGGTWCHLQPIVSAVMTLYKPDVLQALIEFFTCRCAFHTLKDETVGDRRNSYSRTSFLVLLRRSSVSIPLFPSGKSSNKFATSSDFLSTERVTETTEFEMSRIQDPSRMSTVTIEPEDDDAEGRVTDDELWPTTPSSPFPDREQQEKPSILLEGDCAEARVIDDELWPTTASTLVMSGREQQQGKNAEARVVDDKLWPTTSSALFTIPEPLGESAILEDVSEARVVDDEPWPTAPSTLLAIGEPQDKTVC